MFSVKKVILENGKVINVDNKYAEYCKKNFMPQKIRVLRKENVKKAIEIALKPGADIAQNDEILKLTELKNVSEINTRNLCCISHRWCSTSLKVLDFVDELLSMINYGLFSCDEMASDKQFIESMLWMYEVIRKAVVYGFDSFQNEYKKAFYEELYKSTSLYGITKNKLPRTTIAVIDIPYKIFMERHLMAGKLYPSFHDVNLSEDNLNDQIASLLLFEITKEYGQLPRFNQEDVDCITFSFPRCKHSNDFFTNLRNLKEGVHECMKSMPKNVIEIYSNEALASINHLLRNHPSCNRKSSFNGHDPMALFVLLMLTKSTFSYFWIDVFCAPQGGKATPEETLQSVKDGMAVFSLATVIIVPPLDVEKWIECRTTHISGFFIEEYGLDDKRHYFPYLPLKSFDDRFFLFSNAQYFQRMWTFHEAAIASEFYYWWQYMFGPFKEMDKAKNEVQIHVEKNDVYKTGPVISGLDYLANRKYNLQALQEFGPGDSTFMWCMNNNFSTMQTTYDDDWNRLAQMIFNLDINLAVSDAVLQKKVSFYSTYLLQYSAPNRKHCYAWLENPYVINHSVKYDHSKNLLLTGCIEDDSMAKRTTLKIANGVGTLDGRKVLSKCEVYEMKFKDIKNFLEQSPMFKSLLGFHAEEVISHCQKRAKNIFHIVLGKYELPDSLKDVRKHVIESTKKSNKSDDAQLQRGVNLVVKYLKDKQSVLFFTSPSISMSFGVIECHEREFLDKDLDVKKISSAVIVLN